MSAVEISTEKARAAVIALTEMRGFVGIAPRRERDFMLPRIDACIDVFGISDIVQRIHHDHLEGVVRPEAPVRCPRCEGIDYPGVMHASGCAYEAKDDRDV